MVCSWRLFSDKVRSTAVVSPPRRAIAPSSLSRHLCAVQTPPRTIPPNAPCVRNKRRGMLIVNTPPRAPLSLHPMSCPQVLSSDHTIASSDGIARKGDVISYTAEVSNLGNTCLTDIEVRDAVLGRDLECGTGTRNNDKNGCICTPCDAAIVMPVGARSTIWCAG